jgi:acetyl-CoA C-acetyltransferase
MLVQELLKRTKIDPALIDDSVFGQSYANGEYPCIGRWVALAAGLPESVPGIQLDRRCASGLQALTTAAAMVQTGACDVVLAGGIECMSAIEYYTTDMRWGRRAGTTKLHDRIDRGRERSQPVDRFGQISGMIETAENLAQDYAITREDADHFAVDSHRKATAAWESGMFADEVIPISIQQRKGDAIRFERDEGVRPDATFEKLSRLSPIMSGGTVTAGNASQQNDAASVCLVVAEDQLQPLGLDPMGFLVGWAAVGCAPSHMGIGPVPATARLMSRAGLKMNDIGLVELNEAFAAQAIAVLKSWDMVGDPRVNVQGSGISLGHPIGATGMRIMTTLLHAMRRRSVRYGLETMCVGGGQGMAAIFERG